MKIKIWDKEDYFFPIGLNRIDMDASVVEIGEEPIPLSQGRSMDVLIGEVGSVTIVDGEIFGEVTFFDDTFIEHFARMLEEELIRFTGYYRNVIRKIDDNGNEYVASCKLVEVIIFPTAEIPGYPRSKE